MSDRQLEQSLDHRLSVPGDPLDLISFNIYDRAARQWIKEHLTPARPRRADEVGLVVIFGFGKFAQSLLKNLVELAHFENRRRLRIVVFDRDLEIPAKLFLSRWPQLSPHQVWDDPSKVTFDPAEDEWSCKHKRPPAPFQIEDSRAIEYAANIHFCERTGQVADRAVVDSVARLCGQSGVRPFVVVGYDHDDQNYAVGVDLHNQLKRFYGINEAASRTLPIYAYLPYSEALQRSLLGREPFPLIGFSDCRHSISLQSLKNRLAEELARVIALDYRRRYTEDLADVSVTDLNSARSRELWNSLPDWERATNLKAAEHALIKLQMLGFKLVDHWPGPTVQPPRHFDLQSEELLQKLAVLSEVEHYRYVAERLLEGWQWAETKSQAPPRRPNLCSVEDLHRLTRANPQYALEWQKDWTQLQAVLQHLKSCGLILETTPSERVETDVTS